MKFIVIQRARGMNGKFFSFKADGCFSDEEVARIRARELIAKVPPSHHVAIYFAGQAICEYRHGGRVIESIGS